MNDRGELFARFPELDIQDLDEHVERMEARNKTARPERKRLHGRRDRERREDALQRAASSSGPRFRRYPDRVASSSRPQLPLLEATQQGASSGSRDNPIKLEPIEDDDEEVGGIITPDDCGSDVSWTLVDSDESDASIYGLRHMLHEIEEGSEISAASSDEDDEKSVAEKEAVVMWRTANDMRDDMDFAYCYVTFDEAYKEAG